MNDMEKIPTRSETPNSIHNPCGKVQVNFRSNSINLIVQSKLLFTHVTMTLECYVDKKNHFYLSSMIHENFA